VLAALSSSEADYEAWDAESELAEQGVHVDLTDLATVLAARDDSEDYADADDLE
jgi:hypothetical protein